MFKVGDLVIVVLPPGVRPEVNGRAAHILEVDTQGPYDFRVEVLKGDSHPCSVYRSELLAHTDLARLLSGKP